MVPIFPEFLEPHETAGRALVAGPAQRRRRGANADARLMFAGARAVNLYFSRVYVPSKPGSEFELSVGLSSQSGAAVATTRTT